MLMFHGMIRLVLLPILRYSVSLIAFVVLPALSAGLNDTGITSCGDSTASDANCTMVSDDAGSFPRQDARYGRDAQAGLKLLTKVGGSRGDANGNPNGFDFSKIDSQGNVQNSNNHDWACTKDNVTGLIWEVKTTSGLRNQNHTYSWFKSNVGTANGGSCSGGTGCDTEKFVADVNAARLCGYTDWRMPTTKELESLVDYSRINPPIDPDYFPNTAADYYWTGTNDSSYPGQFAWFMDFMTGSAAKNQPAVAQRVRLVRGTPTQSQFTANGTTVTDNKTGLMWKRDYEMVDPAHPGNWQDRKDTFTWQRALQRAVNDRTAGYADWRLPNVRELRSLVDESRHDPAIDTSIFPPTQFQAWFWSSSPFLDFFQNQNMSWAVNFDAGVDIGNPRIYAQYVRLVRGGDYFDNLAAPTSSVATTSSLSVSTNGTGTGTITMTTDTGVGYNCTSTGGILSGTCLTILNTGSSVMLTANPASGSTFSGWSGVCTNTSGTCSVYMNAANSVTATFASDVATPPACSYSLNKSSESLSASAYNVNVIVTTTCTPTAVSNVTWITVAAVTAVGNGTSSVSYAVAENTGAARTGTLTISGQTFTVTQAGPTICSVTLGTTSASVPVAGIIDAKITINNASSCATTPLSNASWITITASGPTSVFYTVDQNTDTSTRTGTLTILDKTFTVTQAGVPCTYTVGPSSRTAPAVANVDNVSVTTSSACTWTGVSSATWMTVTAGSTGTGNGNVGYSVTANPGTTPRIGSLTIAGRTFTLTQVGTVVSAPPTCTLTASPAVIPSSAVPSTLTASCAPTATTFVWTGGTCVGTTGASCTVTPSTTTSYTVVGSNTTGSSNTASATVLVGIASQTDVRVYVPAAQPGFVSSIRVINIGTANTQVKVARIDGATGVVGAAGILTTSLPVDGAVTFTAQQIEAALALAGTAPLAASDRPRIRVTGVSSALEVQSFVLQPGGLFSEMSGMQSGTEITVATYVPSADVTTGYTSYIRVINPGVVATPVTIALIDAAGTAGPLKTLIASMPAGAAKTFSSAQIESVIGTVAAGLRPRLLIIGNTVLEVQSFITQPGGGFTIISTGQ